MKFLQTADWQIGMKAAHVGAAGEKVRVARLSAARNVVDIARAHRVDFMLLAGDTFEDNDVEGVLVQKVVDILQAAPCPVFVLSGNHDPLVPGCVFDHPAWTSAKNVMVFRAATPVQIAGATLLPCPVFEHQSSRDPSEVIPNSGNGVRIGIAHGSVQGVGIDVFEDFPIPLDTPTRRGLHYLAIGHWHSTFMSKDASGATRLAYSGTHETTKFGELDSGNVLIVDVDGPDLTPRVTKVHSGVLRWEQLTVTATDVSDIQALQANLEAFDNPAATLIDIRLSGALPIEALRTIERLHEILDARFLFGRIDRSLLAVTPSDTRWIESLPVGPVRATAAKLAASEDSAAQGALITLFRIAREGAP
jgi:DNA repair exonuclease SbcCD nuclease subunit